MATEPLIDRFLAQRMDQLDKRLDSGAISKAEHKRLRAKLWRWFDHERTRASRWVSEGGA